MKTSSKEDSRKKNILKLFMKQFRIEERLKLFHYSSNKKGSIKWPQRLRSSLYSEACEYVKQLQREEIDFSAKIQGLKDHSYHQYNDLVNQQNTFGYGQQDLKGKDNNELKDHLNELKNDINQQKKELKNDNQELKEDINELKKNMNELKKDNDELKKGIMDFKNYIENLSNQIQKQ